MPRTLTAAEIAALADAPNTEGYDDGRYWVAPNLYIQIVRNSASWLMRFTQRGRHRAMGLGPVRNGPTMTGAKRLVTKYMRIVHEGGDPIAFRRAKFGRTGLPGRQSNAPTFRAMANEYIKHNEDNWRDPFHALGWAKRLRDHVYPVLGDKPVDEITVEDVIEILEPIWRTHHPTATKTLTHIRQVCEWAIALDYRTGSKTPIAVEGIRGHRYIPLQAAAIPNIDCGSPFGSGWSTMAGD